MAGWCRTYKKQLTIARCTPFMSGGGGLKHQPPPATGPDNAKSSGQSVRMSAKRLNEMARVTRLEISHYFNHYNDLLSILIAIVVGFVVTVWLSRICENGPFSKLMKLAAASNASKFKAANPQRCSSSKARLQSGRVFVALQAECAFVILCSRKNVLRI